VERGVDESSKTNEISSHSELRRLFVSRFDMFYGRYVESVTPSATAREEQVQRSKRPKAAVTALLLKTRQRRLVS
jgi:hypothetical protein